MSKRSEPVTLSGKTFECKDGLCSITLSNLLPEEADLFEQLLTGSVRLICKDGHIEQDSMFPVYEEPAPPVPDPELGEHWPAKPDHVQTKLFSFTPEGGNSFPSYTLKYLGGYEKKTKALMRRVERYGFECLRSRRDKHGQFSELWYLSSEVFAKAELKEVVDRCADMEQADRTKAVVEFLCLNCAFGSLEVCTQRAAMVAD